MSDRYEDVYVDWNFVPRHKCHQEIVKTDVEKVALASVSAVQELDRKVANGLAVQNLYSELANTVSFWTRGLPAYSVEIVMKACYGRVEQYMKTGK